MDSDCSKYRSNQVDVEVVKSESTLKLLIGSLGSGFAVGSECLREELVNDLQSGSDMFYEAEIVKITISIRVFEGGPSIFRIHLCKIRSIENTRGSTFGGRMPWMNSDKQCNMMSIEILPSCLQLKHFTGGLSGHSAAGCPCFSQRRHVPVKTRGLGQSDFEWLLLHQYGL